jgi:hypothetical protein
MLLMLQLGLVGVPESFRLDLLAFASGLDALAGAVGLRWRRRLSDRFAVVFVASFQFAVVASRTGEPGAPMMYLAGAVSLAVSAFVHRKALARQSTYVPVNVGGRGVSGDMASST